MRIRQRGVFVLLLQFENANSPPDTDAHSGLLYLALSRLELGEYGLPDVASFHIIAHVSLCGLIFFT